MAEVTPRVEPLGRRTLWGLVALIALGAVARFATLDSQSFHHDEAVTAGQVLDPSLWATLDQVADGERSPPLYYLLAWAWSTIFGTGEVGLRSFSALIGTLMIPAAFLAGRNLASDRVGIAAALFFSLNPYLIWYSQEARSYILMALFITVGLGALAGWSRSRSARPLWLWVAASALALLSHYFAIFLIAPQAIWLFVRERDKWRRLVAPLAALVLVGLALAPLALTQQGSDRRDGFTERPVSERVLETGLNFVASEDPDPLTGSVRVDALQIAAGLAAIGLAALALYLAFGLGRARRRRVLELAALALTSVLLPAALAGAGFDLLNPRNALGTIVPVLLAAAAVFGSITSGWARFGMLMTASLFAVVTVAFNLSAEMQRENWREAAERMGPTSTPRLIVAPKNGDDPLEFYLDAAKFEGQRFSGGIEVNEVELLSPSGSAMALPGFKEVESKQVPPLFQVGEYRSRKPRLVQPDDLLSALEGRAVVLIDR